MVNPRSLIWNRQVSDLAESKDFYVDALGRSLRFEDDVIAVTVVWPAQEATWGRFVVLADPDGRPVVLAKMR